MSERHYIACDLGAESGRVMLGSLRDSKVTLREIHRFANRPVTLDDSLRWDLPLIFEELKTGLQKAGALGLRIESVSVDSWGVDYALINAANPLLAPAYHYRDKRTAATYPVVRDLLGERLIFDETGIQFMSINTLYHFASDVTHNRALLDEADCFLTIGDWFNYRFSGVARAEESNASTTQMYNPRTRSWSAKIIGGCGFPMAVFPKIVPSGTVLGPLLPDIAPSLGAAQVIATCTHDTGAAVAAVPAEERDDWAYLSSGTWSLLGVELPEPRIDEEVRASNFTNEAGFGGTTRFLKNLSGLWLLQECRRTWAAAGNEIAYGDLTAQAAAAESFRSLIRPDADVFTPAGDMPARIVEYCRATGQPTPATPAQFTRCIFESLALVYRVTLGEIERLTGRKICRLHIVGGGSQSALLNQFAASATGRTVFAGPVEATAIGNVLLQAIALGHLTSLAELRAVVRASFPLQTYQPQDASAWQEASERFSNLPL